VVGKKERCVIQSLGCRKLTRSCHVTKRASELRKKYIIKFTRDRPILSSNTSLSACPSMRKWLWSLWFISFFFFLINIMPKCVGCKKDFKSQGFPAHKKSCKPYKRGLKARLNNVLDLAPVAGPSNDTMILEDAGELGTAVDMLLDEVLVCNGHITDKKNLILLLI
jgi:hypothetical protein